MLYDLLGVSNGRDNVAVVNPSEIEGVVQHLSTGGEAHPFRSNGCDDFSNEFFRT